MATRMRRDNEWELPRARLFPLIVASHSGDHPCVLPARSLPKPSDHLFKNLFENILDIDWLK